MGLTHRLVGLLQLLAAPDAENLKAVAKGIQHLIRCGMAKGFWPAIPALLDLLQQVTIILNAI